MPWDEISRFIKWANKKSFHRGMLCHFYMEEKEKQKQYYTKPDYAYFNLFSSSREWLVKGTTEHGITSIRDKRSPIPCLNCFEVNDKFYEALRKLSEEGNERFELGIILNKRKLKNLHFKVIFVSKLTKPPDPFPPLNQCHHFDWASKRGALWPFNRCDVVRVEIPKSDLLGIPIAPVPYHTIMGVLVKRDQYDDVIELLDWKRFDETEVFPLL